MIRRVENYANGGLESVEEWNPVAGTYVRRNGEGVQVETRALAPTEVAALAAQDTADQAATNGRRFLSATRARSSRARLNCSSPHSSGCSNWTCRPISSAAAT